MERESKGRVAEFQHALESGGLSTKDKRDTLATHVQLAARALKMSLLKKQARARLDGCPECGPQLAFITH
jgi:hypothetical protein